MEIFTKDEIILIILICTGSALVLLVFSYYACKTNKFPSEKKKKANTMKPVVYSELLNKNEFEIKSVLENNYQIERTQKNQGEPIKMSDFEHYFKSAIEEDPDENEITRQFQMLPKMRTSKYLSGWEDQNKNKNRYKNIIPYDDTRVILQNNDQGDYINANYVDGYRTTNAFIAAQAPLPHTTQDFWFMIIQENVTTIVMLTELEEHGQVKCELYWPEGQTNVRFGKFSIQNISTTITPNYIRRELRLNLDNEARVIHHFQYITWPDHGVPLSVQDFTTFLKEVMEIPQWSPIIVHCNAGCGRTGTFIMSHIAILMAINEKQVDFLRILKKLRNERPAMVTKVDQYVFAHFVFLEYFFGEDFSIPIGDNFHLEIQKALSDSSLSVLIGRLEKVETQNEKTQFKLHSLTDEDKAKNRFSTILPGRSQFFLPVRSRNNSNYTNAITVDCYRYPRKFIVTQQPLPDTVEDFWKLIKEYQIHTIISLNKIVEEDPNCPKFWPSEGEEWRFGNVDTLKFFSENTDNKTYNIIRIKMGSRTKENSKIVNIVDVKSWNRENLRPPNVTDLIFVWKKIMTCSGQIVVTCYDGTTASGVFVALAYLLEKINMDHSCDVFTAVKTVRQSRAQFIENPEQLKLLYQAALEYIREFSTYGNFI